MDRARQANECGTGGNVVEKYACVEIRGQVFPSHRGFANRSHTYRRPILCLGDIDAYALPTTRSAASHFETSEDIF